MFATGTKFAAAIAAVYLWSFTQGKDLREYAAALPRPLSYGGKGSWSPWLEWSPCTATCGIGEMTRSRECEPRGFFCRGPSSETNQCQLSPCAVWRDWAGWTGCSATCGQGLRTRARSCSHYVGCEGERVVREPCSSGPCPQWTVWKEWGPCSQMCGGGERLRYRDCTVPGECEGEAEERKECNSQSCCTEWSPWSHCSVTCLSDDYTEGVEKRSRRCTIDLPGFHPVSDTPFGGMGYASKEEHEKRTCKANLPPCAEWSDWSEWHPCSATCDGGEKIRERFCSVDGACEGPAQEAQRCNASPCPQWLPWADWTICDASCGGGRRERSRFCTDPGLCLGDQGQVSPCNEFACPEWSEWAPWTRCSESCNGGYQVRTRVCDQLEGCPGDPKEKRLCNVHQCPSFDQWSPWESCSASCGGGVRGRGRPCVMDDNFCLNDDHKSSRSCQCDGALEAFEPCNTQLCPTWSQWADWGKCSHTCGGGSKTRDRVCVVDDIFCMGGNRNLPSCRCDLLGPTTNTTQVAECNNHICPHWSEWQPWGVCSASCGGGVKSRSRICIRDEIYCAQASPGNPACICEGSDQSHEQCNAHLCPEWEEWAGWSECSAICDGGVKQRVRGCLIDDLFCSEEPESPSCSCHGIDTEEVDCNIHYCSKWKKWGDWTFCSAPCDGGIQERARECDYDLSWCDPSRLLNDVTCQCFGNRTESQPCNQHFCAQFDPWSTWETCSVTCGGGKTHRIRQCNADISYCTDDMLESDPASCECHGEFEEFKDCNQHLCPLWSPWGEWSSCSVSCGIGHMDRKRKCDVDSIFCSVSEDLFSPECQCEGEDVEAKPCETVPCFAWSSWSSWSNCSHVCGGGSRNRARECPQLDACPGLGNEREFCNQMPCPDWGSWSEWSSCSVSCGGGQRARTRSCPLKGGCFPGEPYEAEPCNDDQCPVWAEWGSWGSCSATCGEGNRKRERICDMTDGCLGRTRDVEVCFVQACQLFTHWSAWSPCSKTCGGGLKTRSRVACPTCPSEDEQNPCEEDACPEWASWSPWTPCSKTCGGGQRIRDRVCTDFLSGAEVPQGCVGKKVEVDGNPCSPQPCISW